MKILVTGAAGFIGSALCLGILERGGQVVGIDNHNDYYDPKLKEARLNRHLNHPNYKHYRIDIRHKDDLDLIFNTHDFEIVINLAAQAGVRYSIENPLAYIDTNIVGFANILESCRHNKIKHLVYASSSSVYGSNTKVPFSIHDNVDHPISLYAASKKTNELMAHSYSHLFGLPTTGLRFFTVYGPWDRPDMALQKFTKSILAGKKISVFNYGKHRRDFTFINDIIEGIIRVMDKPATPNTNWDSAKPDPGSSLAPWKIYNIGNSSPIKLLDYIQAIEDSLNVKAKIELLPLQPGDVINTYADVEDLARDLNYNPSTKIDEGISSFIAWYKNYYKI